MWETWVILNFILHLSICNSSPICSIYTSILTITLARLLTLLDWTTGNTSWVGSAPPSYPLSCIFPLYLQIYMQSFSTHIWFCHSLNPSPAQPWNPFISHLIFHYCPDLHIPHLAYWSPAHCAPWLSPQPASLPPTGIQKIKPSYLPPTPNLPLFILRISD